MRLPPRARDIPNFLLDAPDPADHDSCREMSVVGWAHTESTESTEFARVSGRAASRGRRLVPVPRARKGDVGNGRGMEARQGAMRNFLRLPLRFPERTGPGRSDHPMRDLVNLPLARLQEGTRGRSEGPAPSPGAGLSMAEGRSFGRAQPEPGPGVPLRAVISKERRAEPSLRRARRATEKSTLRFLVACRGPHTGPVRRLSVRARGAAAASGPARSDSRFLGPATCRARSRRRCGRASE